MSTDHDLEYGPTPPGAQYEHTDIAVSIGYNFAIWLLVAMVLVMRPNGLFGKAER